MSYSEYKDLAPINNIENFGEYKRALDCALQNKKIKNIALTGPYGSGKSSIIETFLSDKDKESEINEKSVLKISMATFAKASSDENNIDKKGSNNTNMGEKINMDADEIEKGILKQLFYKVKPRKIPQSRYRKLHVVSFPNAFFHILAFLFMLCLFVYIFAPTICEKIDTDIGNFLMKFSPSADCLPWKVIVTVVLLFLCSASGAYLYFKVISGFRVKEIKLPIDATVQSGSDETESVFNKNLDEIMYFFEKTGYRIVFFEDLDRLDDPKIFVHLRELNNLLNNDDAIKKKPVVFIYAVRDDIFSREDRTKFFDFIIPVIPVINSTNSGEILLQRLQEAKENGMKHNISQEFVLDISPYISDMRILQNIYNEFVLYKNTLLTSQELELSDEQMLAMIVFKNLYPREFADIQDEKGIIKKAFEDKEQFINEEKSNIQKKITNYENAIRTADNDTLKSVKELKYAMFGVLMNGVGEFIGFCPRRSSNPVIAAKAIISDDFDMSDLLKKEYAAVRYHRNGSDSYNDCNKEDIKPFVERWESINELEKTGICKMQKEIQSLKENERSLPPKSLRVLLNEYSVKNVLSSEVQENKLLTFLLRRGYIDENYANYINYFKGTSITKDDMNFILSIKNQSALPFEYKLTKTPMVIQRLQEYEFEQKEIYNFDLVDQLLSDGDLINNNKLMIVIKQLSNGQDLSWDFIDRFADSTKHLDAFIKLLAKNWTEMWLHISTDETLTYERQIFYLQNILSVSELEIIEQQNVDDCIKNFVEKHKDILQKLSSCNSKQVTSVIKKLNICFTSIQTNGVPQNVLNFIFDNKYYALNDNMIRVIVLYKNECMCSNFGECPYSTVIKLGYTSLTQYINDNIESYITEVIFKHDNASDGASDIVELLKMIKMNTDLAIKLIEHESFFLENIEDCAGDMVEKEKEIWKPIWDTLLQNKVKISWENVIAYWNIYSINDVLAMFIESHADELSEIDNSNVTDDFIKQFIKSNFKPEVEVKLIPILRINEFDLDINEINVTTLEIMVDCRYFVFTADMYKLLASVSCYLGEKFIIHNQNEYMNLIDDIPMSALLFEKLILSEKFQQEYKAVLFTQYAENNMTENIALRLKTLGLPITSGIFDAAWQYLDQRQRTELLLTFFSKLDAENLEKKFREIGGAYTGLADRTRPHEVTLELTDEHEKLAKYLRDISYITSFKQDTKKDPAPVTGQENIFHILKLRIKQVK